METIQNRTYSGIIIGMGIRGSIANDRIFRVRRGNGYYNAILGKRYQDQYAYFVPSSINNPASAARRVQWAAAVAQWKNDLTDSEKEAYNKRALKGMHMSGYNLFMREAMKGEVSMFVNRGNIAVPDYTQATLTTNGNWHELDLSSIVSSGAKAVLLRVAVRDDIINAWLRIKTQGNADDFNSVAIFSQVVNQRKEIDMIIPVNANRKIEYRGRNVVFTLLYISVGGWWT